MRTLLDTNILLRISDKASPHHAPALGSLRKLASAGLSFCIGSQTIGEFLAVATRPVRDRGLGMDQATADAELQKLVETIEVLYDSPQVLAELRRLVVAYRVTGNRCTTRASLRR